MEPRLPAVGAWSPSHWTTKEVPPFWFKLTLGIARMRHFAAFLFLSNLLSHNALMTHMISLVAQTVKHLLAVQETWVQSLGWEDLWRRKWQPTPVLLPGKFHGWRSLVGYSPRDRKELDTTEQLHSLIHDFPCILWLNTPYFYSLILIDFHPLMESLSFLTNTIWHTHNTFLLHPPIH